MRLLTIFLAIAAVGHSARAQTPADLPPYTQPPEPPSQQKPSDAPQQQVSPQVPPEPELTINIYGFAMLDIGYDFGHIGDPLWQDVLRPTKLPAFPDEFGKGPRTFAAVRQTRFGTSWELPTDVGTIKGKFEWELFGVGVDAGQTTFRLRHAVGYWKGLRAGQTWSPFMDPDVFPDSIEYWGPPGMAFFRNVQLAYSFWQDGDSDFTFALERPGASADTAGIGDRVDLTGVVPRFPAPDLSADLKVAFGWGYVRAAGIGRYMRWDDLAPTPIVQGHVWGWGANVSSNIKVWRALLKVAVVYGSAIENYMNDAPADVAPKSPDPVVTTPQIEGEGLPLLGVTAFVDFKWNDYLTSTAGFSGIWIDNSDGQAPDAFHSGYYALGNLLIHPARDMFFGGEFQWGRRRNNSDGFSVNDYRLQFSFKFMFDKQFGPKP